VIREICILGFFALLAIPLFIFAGAIMNTSGISKRLITACSVAKADIWEVSRINVFFVAVIVFVLLLITYVPVIPMSLVRLFYE
jgi:TRAP-type C4-dicarboxylate transport system permease large subunit